MIALFVGVTTLARRGAGAPGAVAKERETQCLM